MSLTKRSDVGRDYTRLADQCSERPQPAVCRDADRPRSAPQHVGDLADRQPCHDAQEHDLGLHGRQASDQLDRIVRRRCRDDLVCTVGGDRDHPLGCPTREPGLTVPASCRVHRAATRSGEHPSTPSRFVSPESAQLPDDGEPGLCSHLVSDISGQPQVAQQGWIEVTPQPCERGLVPPLCASEDRIELRADHGPSVDAWSSARSPIGGFGREDALTRTPTRRSGRRQ